MRSLKKKIYIYIYKADLPIIHCLNVVRCIIVYLKYIIIIMKFQKKLLNMFREGIPSAVAGFQGALHLHTKIPLKSKT